MAEVLDQEKQTTPETAAAAPEGAAEAGKTSGFSEKPALPKRRKRNKKKIIRRIVALVLVAALIGGGIFAWKRFGGNKEQESEVLREYVSRGSITSTVEGNGVAVPEEQESVTLLSAGTVRDIFVTEGDYVTKDTPLFEIDSTEVEESVAKAQERVRDQERNLAEKQNDLAKYLAKPVEDDARAEYAGILIEVKKHDVKDEVSEKEVFATLVDNTRLLLTLYFSYAYENDIAVGQKATVSVPVTMAQISGTVHEIHKVERISDEGSRLFEVVIVVDNPGTLKDGMTATATVDAGETLYPYESGKLEYFRTTEIKAPMTGKLTWFEARDYQKVAAGESIAHIKMDSENREDEIKAYNDRIDDAKQALEDAQKALEKEQENLKSLSATAPIDGTVVSLGISIGEEAKAGTVAVSIANLSTMKVEAMVDEMYVNYIKAGEMIELTTWGDVTLMGTIESVSLSAKSENGVSRFPVKISVDNSEGQLNQGTTVNFSFAASQSDDCLMVPIQCVKSAQTIEGKTCKVLFVETDMPFDNAGELDTSMMEIPEGFQPVIVETGISNNRNIEILSGAEEGMCVYAGVVSNDMGMGMGLYF
ncbi:MAG: HlyD family efflux transporter periplasmic adaptor subunit [Ruminococcaceae bacterium]|nr:HlyD family efflux transporter periplasmic adaptor subunit [Oscillospiraceae bacterium]